jgi:hypothetical protein
MALLLAAALVIAGCGQDSTKPPGASPDNENPTLEGDLGGLSATAESPAFGDAALAASAAAEAPVADAMANDPQITRWAAGDSARTYAVTILWGFLASDPALGNSNADSGSVPVVDWSGHLEVNRGGVLVRSTIAFERGDYIIRPRTDRTRVDWVSHTAAGFDGLRLLIHQPMPAGETGELDSLTIVAGAHTWRFLVNELADLERTEDIDALGHRFSIQSFLVEPGSCTRGFMGGVWNAPVDSDSMGTFRGRWVSRTGEVTGFVRGHYGVNERGRRVLFGKWVDASGNFQGFLRGTWVEAGREGGSNPGGRVRNFGSFGAEILDADQRPIGSVRGRWRSTPGGSDGVFDGTWSKGCARP